MKTKIHAIAGDILCIGVTLGGYWRGLSPEVSF